METNGTTEGERSIEEIVSGAELPELGGAPMEVRAAAEIRKRILNEADDVLSAVRENEILSNQNRDPALLGGMAIVEAERALQRLRRQSSAAWWLAQERRSAQDVLVDLLHNPDAESRA